jgi:hypothetical protein
MKKLLVALLVINGAVYANCDNPTNAQSAVNKLHKWNKTTIQVNYTPDQSACAATCASNIKKLDSTITVKMKALPTGTGTCKFSKPD